MIWAVLPLVTHTLVVILPRPGAVEGSNHQSCPIKEEETLLSPFCG